MTQKAFSFTRTLFGEKHTVDMNSTDSRVAENTVG